jgi:starch phosphorylase
VRLAQYGLLGIGGARVLKALEIQPAAIHLNEGHPALAALEQVAEEMEDGLTFAAAVADVRERFVFTTHTPVAAGNETYTPEEFLPAYADIRKRLELDEEAFLDLCRGVPGGTSSEPTLTDPGMTPLAIRMSRSRNGVSKLHGEVARAIWKPLFAAEVETPITHVTNGAHLPTFISDPIRKLFADHLGTGWMTSSADPASWEPVFQIPNAELWAARCESRGRLIEYLRSKDERDSLLRGEQLDRVRMIRDGLENDSLTIGFARRLATYKRLNLLTHDPARAQRIFSAEPPLQLVIAGKAHPNDSPGKDTLQRFYAFEQADPTVAQRVVIVEDYDIGIARELVAGCDVWVNLPRKPMEASGTSGMKSAFNGGLQLSILDGWWAEGYNGSNGWAIPGDGDDPDIVDAHDAELFYDLLEYEVIPLFHERDAQGVPQRWCERVKESLFSCAPSFTATRMVNDYVERIYRKAR